MKLEISEEEELKIREYMELIDKGSLEDADCFRAIQLGSFYIAGIMGAKIKVNDMAKRLLPSLSGG